jgi:uncharacterized protein GlcG (DUF336 family)
MHCRRRTAWERGLTTSTWTHIEARSHAEALDVMHALRAYRSCVVQESTNGWSVYVRAGPMLVAEIVAAVGLSGCHAVDEAELAAAGISHG